MNEDLYFHEAEFSPLEESVFPEYLGELLRRLDAGRVRASCARERVVAFTVGAAVGAARGIERAVGPTCDEVLDDLARALGWNRATRDELVEWLSYYPDLRETKSHDEKVARQAELNAQLADDPYWRVPAFWDRCAVAGAESFLHFWAERADPFGPVVALVDEAATAFGDE